MSLHTKINCNMSQNVWLAKLHLKWRTEAQNALLGTKMTVHENGISTNALNIIRSPSLTPPMQLNNTPICLITVACWVKLLNTTLQRSGDLAVDLFSALFTVNEMLVHKPEDHLSYTHWWEGAFHITWLNFFWTRHGACSANHCPCRVSMNILWS